MSSPASPKRRPAPTRSLRQPQSLSVNEAGGGGARPTDSAALRQSYQDRAEANKATMIAMESLLEDVPVSRDAFKEACTYLLPSSYLSILHERHLSSLCSHPLCPNPPRKPFTSFSTPRSRIVRDPSDGSKRIVEVTGNEEDGFCSKECWKRSEWVRRSGMLGEEGRWLRGKDGASGGEVGKKWELLEEVEERLVRERVVEEEKEMERRACEEAEKGREVASREEETDASRTESSVPGPLVFEAANGVSSSRPPPPTTAASPTPSLPAPVQTLAPTTTPSPSSPPPPTPPLSGPAALIASLTIKERATPSLLPQPPSLNPTPPNASPKPSSSSASPKTTPKIGSSPPPMSHKTAARLKEERRRADASSQTLIPGSIGGLGRMGDVLVGASSGGGKGKGNFEKSSAGKTKEVEVAEGEGGGGKVEGHEEDDDEDEEDVDGLKDVWEEMYKARGELEEGGGEGETT